MNATENTACEAIGSVLKKSEPQEEKRIIVSGIYGLRNKTTGKWYIGQSVNIQNRWDSYSKFECWKQRKLYNALKKYGYDDFDKVILEECNPDPEIMSPKEDYWMDYYNSIDDGYNIRRAQNKGPMPLETKERISFALKGIPQPEYRKKLISQTLTGKYCGEKHPFFGKKHSEETKRKIREARAKQVMSAEHIEKMAMVNRGKKRSEETKQKLSNSHKGKKFTEESRKKMSVAKQNMTEETKRKMSKARTGAKMSEETKRKISETLKRRNVVIDI